MLISTNNCEIKVRYAAFIRKQSPSGYGDVLDANGVEDPGFKYNRAPAGIGLNKSADPPNTFVPTYRLQLNRIDRHSMTCLTAMRLSQHITRCRWQHSKYSPRSRHRHHRYRSHHLMRLQGPTLWGEKSSKVEFNEKYLQFPTQCTTRAYGRNVLEARA